MNFKTIIKLILSTILMIVGFCICSIGIFASSNLLKIGMIIGGIAIAIFGLFLPFIGYKPLNKRYTKR